MTAAMAIIVVATVTVTGITTSSGKVEFAVAVARAVDGTMVL